MDCIPTLQFGGGKAFGICRAGVTIDVGAGTVRALEHGDQVVIHRKASNEPLTYGYVVFENPH